MSEEQQNQNERKILQKVDKKLTSLLGLTFVCEADGGKVSNKSLTPDHKILLLEALTLIQTLSSHDAEGALNLLVKLLRVIYEKIETLDISRQESISLEGIVEKVQEKVLTKKKSYSTDSPTGEKPQKKRQKKSQDKAEPGEIICGTCAVPDEQLRDLSSEETQPPNN